MNNETLEKAKELNVKIGKIKEAIGNISYHYRNADRNKPYKRYDWLMRVCNKKVNGETVGPGIFLFDNDDIHGSDIPIDEELLLVIKGYFENKLKDAEQQFNELN